ncbi:MAG: hypothetical protein PWQ31_320 [Eubacteriales bacterium]|nr:hypothetical protein [Eubacteriales bacterium]
MDSLYIRAVVEELRQKLLHGKVERIYQPLPEEIQLLIRAGGEKHRLLISARADAPRLHITTTGRDNPQQPPLFCMVLRKHLEGGRIVDLFQEGWDRIVRLRIENRDEMGELAVKDLIVEIMGKHSNIILVDYRQNVIYDAIKRYSHAVSRHREVLPGRPYIPPPRQEKVDPLALKEETDLISLAAPLPAGTKGENFLVRHVEGLAPFMAREVLHRAGLESVPVDEWGSGEFAALLRQLQALFRSAAGGNFSPHLYYADQRPHLLSAFPLYHLGNLPATTGPASFLADSFYRQKEELEKTSSLKQKLLQTVAKEMERQKRRIEHQEEAIAQAGDPEHYRLLGELLYANLYRIPAGATSITVENYYQDPPLPVTIPLREDLEPSRQAEEYFRLYRKAKNTIARATTIKEEAIAELEYLESVRQALLEASTLEELAEIEKELSDEGYLSSPASKTPAGQKKATPPSPAVYLSSDGLEILVGKNNRQNDYLTMKLASPDDIWLHARNIPGSHVVIRTGGKDVPTQTLLEAASLAAYFSRGRAAGKAEVDYTAVRHVRKPRHARPGMVVYENQKTLVVKAEIPPGVEKKA